jgi:hypothetical protein
LLKRKIQLSVLLCVLRTPRFHGADRRLDAERSAAPLTIHPALISGKS